MPQIIRTVEFANWVASLRDVIGQAKILGRLERLARGNPGDVAHIGDGLSELRINFGPGYRVYFGTRGSELVIVLAGGAKSSQRRDIEAAKAAWQQWKEDNNG